MDDIYKNFEEYNPNKKRKILIVFDDMIADVLSNKQPNQTVTELFFLFLSHSLFSLFQKVLVLD